MTSGYNGRVAVFWSQTEIDGLEAASMDDLAVGVTWSWRGCVTRLPNSAANYSGQTGSGQALMALAGIFSEAAALRPVSRIAKIALTNGAQSFEAELTLVEGRKDAVLLFEDGCPARDQEFWVCAVEEIADASQVDAGNVVSFQTHRNATRKALVLTPQMAASAAE